MNRRAFTLIEVVIALALIIALVGAAWMFLFQLLGTRDQALRVSRQQLAATTLIERLESDLAASLVGDPHFGAGVRGDERSISVLTRSVPAALAERGADDPTAFADLERAEYRFSGTSVSASRRVVSARAAAPAVALGGPLHLVRFRYHDGSGWRRQYDSLRADELPLAVEIAVWFEPWEPPADPPAGLDAAEESPWPEDEELLPEDEPLFDDEPLMSGPDDRDIPPPDRVRVISIPDAGDDQDDDAPIALPEEAP